MADTTRASKLQFFFLFRFLFFFFNASSSSQGGFSAHFAPCSYAPGLKYLKSGIPQGTVLGPVLFLIFLNDLPSVVENESSIFADDTTMFTFGEDLAYSCRSLTLDLNAASHWAKVWDMLY